MRESLSMLVFIASMAAATALTRFLPFWLPPRWLDNAFVRKMRDGLPAAILLILLVFSLKDAQLQAAPWGLNELAALSLTVGFHLWRRNALLSIGVGTALFMVLKQTGALAVFLPG